MKKTTTSIFGVAICLTINTLNAAQWTPTQADLDSAVANAAQQWGVTARYPIRIRMEDASGCGVKLNEERDSPEDASEDLSRGVVISNLMSETPVTIQDESDITSTITFDGGGSDSFRKQEKGGTAGERVKYWVIRINASCRFLTPETLQKFVLHEYGHTLGLGHSKNSRSIMFWVVNLPVADKKYGSQSITEADRSAVPVQTASVK